MSDFSRLPPELRSPVELELQSGERIVWMDQPIPGRIARSAWPLVMFGIPWTAFSLFWIVMATKGVASSKDAGPFWLFPLFGLPFVLIGFGMLSGPYWAKRGARRTAYVLTDRRAIIFKASGRGSMNVRSFEPGALTELNRTQYPDGAGDLVFTEDLRRGSKGRTYTTRIGFMAVRDVKSVEEMVRTLASRAVVKREPA
jgi:hypothetical protein